MQEGSLWQVDFDNLYFLNTLNKTHQGIFVLNRNNRLHTINKKHVYKERKETTHERVSERKTYINIIEEKKKNIMYVYKWSQDLMYKNNVSKKERKEKKKYIISSLHPSKRNNTPPKTMIQKLTLPLRVTTLISKTSSPFCHK